MLNKGREVTPNSESGNLLPRVSVQGWPVWHRSAHFSSVFAPGNLLLCQVEPPMSVCLEEWKRVFHPLSSEDTFYFGFFFFLSMSNHLLKCQVLQKDEEDRSLEDARDCIGKDVSVSASEQLSFLFCRRMCCTQGFAIKVCLPPRNNPGSDDCA